MSRRRALLGLVVIALSSFTAASADAATIKCLDRWPEHLAGDPGQAQAPLSEAFSSGFSPQGRCHYVGIIGQIGKGDHAEFLDLYRKNHRAIDTVYLASPGGDTEEAIAIGRTVRKYLLDVYAPSRWSDGTWYLKGPIGADEYARALKGVPRPLDAAGADKVAQILDGLTKYICIGADCVCASACALVWFGGVNRSGTVGLHRPVITDAAFKVMAAAEATSAYRQVLDRVRRYLAEMEAPLPLIDRMVATDSSKINWVDEYDDNVREPPSIAEWINSSCGSFTETDGLNHLELFIREHDGAVLTTEQEEMLRGLRRRNGERVACAIKLKRVHVDALAPP